MIIPYYNCLIIGYRYNDLTINEETQFLIKDYLQEYLSSSHINTNIIIKNHGLRNSNIISRMINIMHMFLTNLSIPVYQINNTYTLQERINLYYQALKNITVKHGQINNKPAVIDNLAHLKKYHLMYQSENATKGFLKDLLIKEINHEKRCIVYRKTSQVQNLINSKIQQIKGDIKMMQQIPQMKRECSNIFIVLVNQKTKDCTKLQSLINMLTNQFPINQKINRQITSTFTLSSLHKNAVNKCQQMFISHYKNLSKVHTNQIFEISHIMMTVANLKAILKEGTRLVEQDRKLKEQFLKFVAEMNNKYTKEVNNYLIAFKQYNQYIRQKTSFFQKKRQQQKINLYLMGKLQQVQYIKMQQKKKNRQCSIIQNVIKGFLIRKRQQEKLMSEYIQQKRRINSQYKEQYGNFAKNQNEEQIKKLQTFNRFKYGFCCCIYIIDINNKTNSNFLSPSQLSRLFHKLNKTHQLLTRIVCSQSSIEINTIEGRSFRQGNHQQKNHMQSIINKQNSQTNNKSYQSIINQFDSQYNNNNNLLLKQKSSRVSLPTNKNKTKEKFIHLNGSSYQFKLMQNGKLYGRGSNKYGQLAIQNQEFVSEYTLIFPGEKIKIVTTGNYHTIVVTLSNKIFHFGKSKGKLQASKIPIQITFNQKLIIKQVVITHQDIYFLTDNNKIYSFQSQKTVRLPKQMELSFDQFHIIKTGGLNLQCTYVLAYWINSLDLLKKQQIERFLLQSNIKERKIFMESILVEDSQKQHLKEIHQLSSIFQQSSF